MLLVHPNVKVATSVTCNASGTVVSASLDQLIDSKWKPLAFFSRKLSQAELKYSAFDCKLLAIYLSTKQFCYFLEDRQFAIYTDHLPLTTVIASAADHSPRQARYLSYVAEFMTDLQHLPGKTDVVADAFSRSCAELNAVLASQIDFRDMALCQHTDPDSLITRGKLTWSWCYERSTLMESKYCVIQHMGTPDLSFQHHDVRRCSTLSMVSLI